MNKFIIIMILFAPFACLQAKEYSAEYIISLEKRFNTLRSEIYITENTEPDSYRKQNAALYYIKKRDWGESIRLVQPDKNSMEECQDYNNILYGISMQGLKNKKSALSFYNRVHLDSVHYATAQLNAALLYLQDGFSEKSVIIINKVLNDSLIVMDSEIRNKLLLTLGNIYIKQKKYHKSREVFRAVETRSIYSGKAMIGLAYAAVNLKDYSTAQRTLHYLIKNNSHDLAGDESYLVLAFSYELQGNYEQSSEYYDRAAAYYKKRLNYIGSAIRKKKSMRVNKIKNKHNFIVSGTEIDLLDDLPAAFFDTYSLLEVLFLRIKENTNIKNKFHERAIRLYYDYRKVIKQLLLKRLQIRNNTLIDYLKQSNYGLVLSNDQLVSAMDLKVRGSSD